MGKDHKQFWFAEGLITALAVGGFLIILGFMFALTSGTWQAVTNFFSDFTTTAYPVGSTTSNVILPAPANPDAHAAFYTAVINFCIGIGVLQVVILALRLFMHSPFRRISETVGNLIFWFGAAIAANVFLLAGTLTGWFQFWAVLLLIIGVSLIARAILHLARRPPRRGDLS
jgi:hypothetical protein